MEMEFIFGRCLETSHCSSLGKGTEGSGGQGKSESGSCRLRDGSLSPETGRAHRGSVWDRMGTRGGTGQ